MKIVILKDMDDDSVLRILSCADDVDTDALAKDIFYKKWIFLLTIRTQYDMISM